MASPSSLKNTTTTVSSTTNDTISLDRIRQMLLLPPAVRPPEFENPLEKIEQLLTCPICLDRYKQPKLLPCHHTFCLSCLDNCVDVVHRILKCPECRAEHPVPYEGVRNFQSNYTLTGFLDIHLQATDDNAAQLEAYIQRYNLERCKICDEKAVLDVCAHCDRRACNECRGTHLEMLKRDLTRMLNQVKRLSNRITEASDGLSKGAELLSLNCETAKDEVKEYFRRYHRELKKREEMFIEEIETFNVTETRLMRNLRDVLEIESSNMSEGCAYLEAALKGEREVHDSELVKLKNVFAEGLDYLRNFQPDADELFSKKLRFSPGDDASKLPTAIASFGELTVMLPQFAGRYLPLEQSYLPRPMKLGYESDNYRYASKRTVDLDENISRTQNDFRSGTSRYGMRVNASVGEEDVMSIRYRRRQQMEEEAWNRLRPEKFDNSSHHQLSGGSGGTSSSSASGSTFGNTFHRTGNSPWSRMVIRNNLNPTTTTAATMKSTLADESSNNFGGSLEDSSDNDGLLVDNKILVLSKGVVLNEGQPELESTFIKGQPLSEDVSQLDVSETPMFTTASSLPSRNFSKTAQEPLQERVSANELLPYSSSKLHNCVNDISGSLSAVNYTNGNITSMSADLPSELTTAMKVTKKPPLPRQISSDDTSLNEKIENIRTAHEMRRANRILKEAKEQRDIDDHSSDSNYQQANSNTSIISASNNTSDESEYENEPVPVKQPSNRFRIICRSSSESKEPVVHQRSDPTPLSAPAKEAILAETITAATINAEETSLPIPVTHYPGEQLPSWLLRRRQRYQRSKTNPDLLAALTALNGQQSNLANLAFLSTNTNSNNLSNIGSSTSSRVQQLLLQKSNRFTASTGHEINVDGSDFVSPGTATSSGLNTDDRWSRYRKRSVISTDHGNPCESFRLLPAPRFISTVDYLSKSKPRLVFGRKGCNEGELNWPRGVAAINANEFAICDSSNHRICIFTTGGRLVRMFGKYGTADGHLDSTAGLCYYSRHKQLIISDRYNHRIVIYDQNGQQVQKFGGHGPSSGRFNNPWGIAVDDMGVIYVVDKDNHRVQMFDNKGQFAGKFGAMGPGLGQFHHPQFIAIHKRTENIYVTDSSNHRVCVFDRNGNPIFQFGSEGYQDGQMKFPRGIAVDDQGFIIIADSGNNRVQIFYPDGRFMHSFGTWGNAPGQLKGVEAVALIGSTIVVSDRENHRIQLF
ncbi:unnamed protein product [Thelazia callipaeda]|uniref:RING-type domain-containing protein n=1 Tax=Thelazia callipaeda TaxID=103827 RepID=A0A158RBT6_THECL|nr:unnamed protein product [Thelazia callipaeda]